MTSKEESDKGLLLVTVEQFASLANVQPSWVYDNYRELKIPHLKLKGHLRFPLDRVIDWIEEQVAVEESHEFGDFRFPTTAPTGPTGPTGPIGRAA